MAISHQINPEADITVWRNLGGYVVADKAGEILANCDRAGTALTLLIAGASARKLSVFDYDGQQFLTGTVDQLQP